MSRLSRRRFLQTTAAASAVFAAPYFIPQRAFGANERVVLGFVGVKNRGMQNMEGFGIVGRGAANRRADCAAVCDVDKNVFASAVKRVEEAGQKPSVFGDYRQLLERKDIDAVVLSVPDHWHALMTVDACRAGKDVYCEKPLTLFVTEGRKMVEVARETGRVVQTGSQQRSDDRFRLACELARNGKLGKLQTVLVGIPAPNHMSPVDKKDTTAAPDSDPPPELNYDLWLGPAPQRPYNVNRVHYKFRFFWDYSGGQMTNFGAHHLDIAQWGLGMDASGPVAIEGRGTFPKEKHLCEVTDTCRITYTYASGVTVVLGQKQKDIPDSVTFIGDQGQVHVTRSKIEATPKELVDSKFTTSDTRLEVSRNHYQNFLDCIASRAKPIADVEIGHRTATVCHLGNIAVRLGRKFAWDPAKEQITGDADAAAMLTRPYRAPWKLA
ncbi:MAG TPA: Gfo/Idh/MocA family oxidoreductase [Pirellulaceae bacterium]|nr:Gfo/Idh/MocA family oxidoreductase [Pirellulaceae bacterium]